MTCIGYGSKFGEYSLEASSDVAKRDVGDALQTPVDSCPLGVKQRGGKLFELASVESEESGTKAVHGHAVVSVGVVRDGNLIEDGDAVVRSLEFCADNFNEISDLEMFKVEHGRGSDGCKASRGERGTVSSNPQGEGGPGQVLFERATLLLSALFSDELLYGCHSYDWDPQS